MSISAAVICMSLALYHEASNQPIEGQALVAQVIYDRAQGHTDNICKVVKKPGKFSPKIRKSLFKHLRLKEFELAKRISMNVIRRGRLASVTHFHTTKVHPRWATDKKHFKRIGRVEDHIFYARLDDGERYF